MSDDVRRIAAIIEQLDDVASVCRWIDRRMWFRDPASLAELGLVLWRQHGHDRRPPWQFRAVFEHLTRQLAVRSGQGNVAQLMRLIAAGLSGDHCRRVAALLAGRRARPHRTAADLATVFHGEWAASDGAAAVEELRACLVQELVLRRAPLDRFPALAGWIAAPDRSAHPLDWLPLSLGALDAEPSTPRYGPRTAEYGRSSLDCGPTVPADPDAPVPVGRPAAIDATATAAVASWLQRSAGRSEARAYALDRPLEPGAVSATLRHLVPQGLLGRTPEITACDPKHAWDLLFEAAAYGGANGLGEHGAYARLAAWRSVAALVGVPGAAFDTVAAAAQACAWYEFDLAGDWFAAEDWDIALLVVSPDGRRLTLLAASDGD